MIQLKRVYEAPSPADGKRILVERLWPRGVRKQDAAVDLWLKEVAPSDELRRWFGHDPGKWPGFQRRYRDELCGRPDEVAQLIELVSAGPVTFVYGSRDELHNAAAVLRAVVEDRMSRRKAA